MLKSSLRQPFITVDEKDEKPNINVPHGTIARLTITSELFFDVVFVSRIVAVCCSSGSLTSVRVEFYNGVTYAALFVLSSDNITSSAPQVKVLLMATQCSSMRNKKHFPLMNYNCRAEMVHIDLSGRHSAALQVDAIATRKRK